jgi:hypothetical protein
MASPERPRLAHFLGINQKTPEMGHFGGSRVCISEISRKSRVHPRRAEATIAALTGLG